MVLVEFRGPVSLQPVGLGTCGVCVGGGGMDPPWILWSDLNKQLCKLRGMPTCSFPVPFSGITILLSLMVFMLLVAEVMPATSDSIPLIGTEGSGWAVPGQCLISRCAWDASITFAFETCFRLLKYMEPVLEEGATSSPKFRVAQLWEAWHGFHVGQMTLGGRPAIVC